MTETTKQVTKEKNPGRVKAGHRLREWNLKNKEDVLKNQKQEPTTETLSEISTSKSSEINTSKSQPKSYGVHMIGVGILSVLAIALLVYFKMSEKTAEASKTSYRTDKKKSVSRYVIILMFF